MTLTEWGKTWIGQGRRPNGRVTIGVLGAAAAVLVAGCAAPTAPARPAGIDDHDDSASLDHDDSDAADHDDRGPVALDDHGTATVHDHPGDDSPGRARRHDRAGL